MSKYINVHYMTLKDLIYKSSLRQLGGDLQNYGLTQMNGRFINSTSINKTAYFAKH
jgi:hypothetical protein